MLAENKYERSKINDLSFGSKKTKQNWKGLIPSTKFAIYDVVKIILIILSRTHHPYTYFYCVPFSTCMSLPVMVKTCESRIPPSPNLDKVTGSFDKLNKVQSFKFVTRNYVHESGSGISV